MPSADDFRKIYAYNREVLEAFYRRMSRLPWAVVAKDREVTWHSMAGVFQHILGVYDGWLNFVVQGARADEAAGGRSWTSLKSMKDLRPYMDDVWRGVDRVMSGLTDAGLRRKVKAPWQPRACSLADALAQVTVEQAHHIGEIIAMMWQEDIRPPEMTWLGTNWHLEDLAKKTARRKRSTR